MVPSLPGAGSLSLADPLPRRRWGEVPGRGQVLHGNGCGDVSVVHVGATEAIDGLEPLGVADLDPTARERAAAADSAPRTAAG